MLFTAFFVTNKCMVEYTCTNFQRWEQVGLPVHKIRCDNAGETVLLEKFENKKYWKLDLTFEYMGRDTPQHTADSSCGSWIPYYWRQITINAAQWQHN